MRVALSLAALAVATACTQTPKAEEKAEVQVQEMALAQTPPMRWGQQGSSEWTRATLAALDREGATILSQVPQDINEYCPNYRELTQTAAARSGRACCRRWPSTKAPTTRRLRVAAAAGWG